LRPQGLAYRLEQTIVGEPGQGIVASRVKWEPNPVTITANEALAADAASRSDKGFPREEAKDFLRQMLAEGDVVVNIVNAQAEALGMAEKTLKRARADLGVKATRVGGLGKEGVWKLSCPKRATTLYEGHIFMWPP
jgi:putative DNA primase/helicase